MWHVHVCMCMCANEDNADRHNFACEQPLSDPCCSCQDGQALPCGAGANCLFFIKRGFVRARLAADTGSALLGRGHLIGSRALVDGAMSLLHLHPYVGALPWTGHVSGLCLAHRQALHNREPLCDHSQAHCRGPMLL